MIKEDNDLLCYRVRGPSMFPLIRQNDLVFARRLPYSAIRPNDTVIYRTGANSLVCHNVFAIKQIDGVFWFYAAGYKKGRYGLERLHQEQIVSKAVALRHKNMLISLEEKKRLPVRFYLGCLLSAQALRLRNHISRIALFKKILPSQREHYLSAI